MLQPYLQVTFRHGRPIAAYYYLPRSTKQKSFRTEKLSCGMLVDYNRAGRAIGLEITAPAEISLALVNRILRRLGEQPLQKKELAPLLAA